VINLLQVQRVASYRGGRYTVQTFEAVNQVYELVREVPASARDIAQATIDGKVLDIDAECPL
jgi:hypothetical protein